VGDEGSSVGRTLNCLTEGVLFGGEPTPSWGCSSTTARCAHPYPTAVNQRKSIVQLARLGGQRPTAQSWRSIRGIAFLGADDAVRDLPLALRIPHASVALRDTSGMGGEIEQLWPPFEQRHNEASAGRQRELGTHALVIGVSAYPVLRQESVWDELGGELTSAAISALRFAEWLNTEFRSARNAPLRSLRVLLSPSKVEADKLGGRIGGAARAQKCERQGRTSFSDPSRDTERGVREGGFPDANVCPRPRAPCLSCGCPSCRPSPPRPSATSSSHRRRHVGYADDLVDERLAGQVRLFADEVATGVCQAMNRRRGPSGN
jgi:hypothetical protein